MQDYNVRKPTTVELLMIGQFLVKNDQKYNIDYDVLLTVIKETIHGDSITPIQKLACCMELIESYYVSVLEGYQSDGPSYCGLIITITWGECCYLTRLVYNTDKTALIRLDCEVK